MVDAVVMKSRAHGSGGFVLPAALLILSAVALVAVALQSLAFVQRQVAAKAERDARVGWAASAVLHEAIHALTESGVEYRAEDWRSPKIIQDGDATLKVYMADTASLLDINTASMVQISRHLQRRSINQSRADQIAAQIADWRDLDDLINLNGAEHDAYLTEGRATPANRRFLALAEVEQLLSISAEELDVIESDFTVFDGKAHLLPAPSVGVPPSEISPGISVRVSVVCCDDISPDRNLRAIVTLTGNSSDPYWLRSLWVRNDSAFLTSRQND
ncbi:hypothetical protein [Pyruvatibacter sp.]|uniref:hypothetical protein n=1 Tax=Pyruvatibacter sp. TaxID=1981328 RepID=UPI0032656591